LLISVFESIKPSAFSIASGRTPLHFTD